MGDGGHGVKPAIAALGELARMPDFDDDLKSQAQRMSALAPMVDAVIGGMAGDFRHVTGTDTKVAIQQGRGGIARDILARRRKENERTPADLAPALRKRYRAIVKYLGPAALPLLPPGMLAHYVRALDTLDSFGHMIDATSSATARTVMLAEYAKHTRLVAALAKAIGISTHSQVMQLAVISELRIEGRQSAPVANGAPAGDWRQHALELEADDDDEAAP
jgi:hypothetical protein